MITVHLHKTELKDRMDAAIRLIDETHRTTGAGLPGPASREARGLAVVLLFAAYENLLKSLTRTLLEGAINCRVGNQRLKPGFQTFALKSVVESTRAKNPKELYVSILPNLVTAVSTGGRTCTISPGSFPDDGSFMKTSQIELWCRTFDVRHPASILRRTWGSVDAIVTERNGIAHGSRTPDEIGRTYTEADMRSLIADWHYDWHDFLTHVEGLASTRDFFRKP